MEFDPVIAVFGLVVTIAVPWSIHRATHPKRRVSYYWAQQPYQAATPASVPVGAPPPGWPMLVTLSLWSSGRADVASSNFDDKKPIVFQFSSPILGEPAPDDLADLGGFQKQGQNRLVFLPARIGGGTVYSTAVVVASPVGMLVRHPLVDVEVVASRVPPQSARTTANLRHIATNGIFWGLLQIALSFLLVLITDVLFPASESTPGFYYTFIGYLFIGGALTIVVTAVVRLARWVSGRSRARRSGAEASGAARAEGRESA
jgi:hypothetical protein